MEQQVISQKQTTKKSTADKKPMLPHGTDFFSTARRPNVAAKASPYSTAR